jgi:hypothetical protein
MSRPSIAAAIAFAIPFAAGVLSSGVGPQLSEAAAQAPAQTPPQPPAQNQDAERQEVMRTVRQLFDAMRSRDTAMLRAAFDTGALFFSTVRPRDGGPPVVRREPFGDFVKAIGSAPPGRLLDERIYNPEIRIDDNLASFWAEYDFYLGDTFSHCGVDVMWLAKLATGWKIIALSDTRRREGCPKRP